MSLKSRSIESWKIQRRTGHYAKQVDKVLVVRVSTGNLFRFISQVTSVMCYHDLTLSLRHPPILTSLAVHSSGDSVFSLKTLRMTANVQGFGSKGILMEDIIRTAECQF